MSWYSLAAWRRRAFPRPPAPARAAAFPTKPVTLICPWPAGGATDQQMRAFAEATQKHLGQPLVVENKTGGSGTVGPAAMAATAKPDGYTLSQIPITVLRLPHMQKVTFDPLKDFTYITAPRARAGGRCGDIPRTPRARGVRGRSGSCSGRSSSSCPSVATDLRRP